MFSYVWFSCSKHQEGCLEACSATEEMDLNPDFCTAQCDSSLVWDVRCLGASTHLMIQIEVFFLQPSGSLPASAASSCVGHCKLQEGRKITLDWQTLISYLIVANSVAIVMG